MPPTGRGAAVGGAVLLLAVAGAAGRAEAQPYHGVASPAAHLRAGAGGLPHLVSVRPVRPVPFAPFAPAMTFSGAETPPPFRAAQETEPSMVSPGRAALFSAVVPGAGQYALGQRRAWVYLVLETAGWVLWAERRSAGDELVREYRDFAWEHGRIRTEPRVDGDFDYYETLTKWVQSGAWDADPSASGVQPETDPSTFNGMIWERAVAIFLPGGPSTPPGDPSYQSALDYYGARGYGTEFLWDWSGSGDDQTTYAQILSTSDERYRQATNVLGAILANHLVSSIDAYLSARGVATPSEVRIVPRREGRSTRWHAAVRVQVGP